MGKYQELADRIRALSESARVAVAVASAQRLMNHHLSLPVGDRDPFIAALEPDLDKLWQALGTPSSEADAALQRILKKRKSEPYANQIGKSGEPRGDDHPFAAAMNALEAYCLREPKFGVGAAMRLIDAASDMAGPISDSLGEDLMSHGAKARRESLARPEFNRVTSAVSLMEREGVTTGSLNKLRKIFAGGELGQSRARREQEV
jgi:hypothetical protein